METRPRFSVIIPVYNRPNELRRAIVSVINQTFIKNKLGTVECIVVDDGSDDISTAAMTDTFVRNCKGIVLCVRHEQNLGRVAARNSGLKKATGEFIVWLDSDDEFLSTYLEVMDTVITKNPDRNVFTCGAGVYNERSYSYYERHVFVPDAGSVFRSGKIGTGSFLFRRTEGFYLPESIHPYGGDGSFSAKVQRQVQEIKELYGQNADGSWLPLGNPWGDDYVMFFMLTRKNRPVGVGMPMYLQHVRQ